MNIAKLYKVPDDILLQVKNLRLMDDVLLVKCFEDNPNCAELLLGLIFKKPAFQAKRVKAMWHGSSVGLAILAASKGWHYKIRVFRDDTADKERNPGVALYETEYAAARAGIDQNAASHHVIYIIKHGVTCKPIDRGGIMIDGGGKNGRWVFGTTALYVNCDCKSRSPLGQLMYDFSCTDPAYINYPILADRVRYFKESRQGIRDICEMLAKKRQNLQKSKAPWDLT